MLSFPMTRGVRGAITIDINTEAAITEAACRLTQTMMAANQVTPGDIACIIFTVTSDLDAAFPAAGARQAGLTQTPLLCTNEIPVPDSLPRCIRALMLLSTNRELEEMRHIYLGEAATLRRDWALHTDSLSTHDQAGDQITGATTVPSYRSTILDIAPYKPGKPISELQREKGLSDIIKMASNENPLGPSPKAVEAVQQALHSLHIYPDGNCFELRRALAEKLQVDQAQLIFGNGSDEVIKMLGLAFLEPGNEVLFCQPTFGEYAYAAHLMGATTRVLPLANHAYDLEAMAMAINSATKLVFICNPNNPTGAYVHGEAVDAFLDRVPDDVLVVFDEAYYEYVSAKDFPDSLSYVRQGRNVVVLRTFSKIYGLAGLRIGYGIAPHHIAELVHRVREPFNVNAPAQIGALAALGDIGHVARSRDVNEAGKVFLYKELARLGLPYIPTEANFIFFNLERDSQVVFERLLDEGVITRSGEVFGCPTWLRVTIGTAAENQRFVRALEKALDE